jgi:hypothetical protein
LSASAPPQWNFETLDGGVADSNGRTGDNVGTFNAAVVYGGQPHVWYRDATNGDLRHAWWTGASWAFETLDGAGGSNGRVNADVGSDAAVTLYGGQPHVWYRDATNGDLRHAWWTGTQWDFETLDGAAAGPHGQLDADVGSANAVSLYGGQPHVWYRDETNGDLRHAWWTGTQWDFETLDGATTGPRGQLDADVGSANAVSLYGGQPHVWYRDNTSADLRHAWWTGSQWDFETLDGSAVGVNGQVAGDVGSDNAVVLYGGLPHVWYRDTTNGDLRHAWWTGTRWDLETLDGTVAGPNGRTIDNVGTFNAVVLYNGQPHVWYHDADAGTLRHAWYG